VRCARRHGGLERAAGARGAAGGEQAGGLEGGERGEGGLGAGAQGEGGGADSDLAGRWIMVLGFGLAGKECDM
jgi:hypothetical protein